MARQTILLFIRALIIGILLNLGVQQVSEPQLPQQESTTIQQQEAPLSQSPASINVHFSPASDN
jgi:hypothetical protein